MSLLVENVLDLIEISGEDEIKKILSAFSCPYNIEIENFIKNKAIEFAKQKLSVTYIISDESDAEILGYFTLAIKPVEIRKDTISKSLSKRVAKFSLYDEQNDSYIVASYLLAQFGKNFAVDNGNRINGSVMMKQVEMITLQIQHMIGLGLIYLDVEQNNQTAIDLYTKGNHFVKFRERKSITDGKDYLVMIKAI